MGERERGVDPNPTDKSRVFLYFFLNHGWSMNLFWLELLSIQHNRE
jgi:hypothetical protein